MYELTTEFVSLTNACGHTTLNAGTGSHLNTEVKQRRASLVPGWVTAWESLVLQASFFVFQFSPHF